MIKFVKFITLHGGNDIRMCSLLLIKEETSNRYSEYSVLLVSEV